VSRNLGTLTSWNPLGLSRPVMGLLLLHIYIYIFISVFNQLDARNLLHNKFYFMPLHDDEHMCSKHVEA